jgi:hypothetical protein
MEITRRNLLGSSLFGMSAMILTPRAVFGQVAVCEPRVFPLTAGQTINVGNVTVTNDATNLYVTYNLNAPATFGTIHLWVGTDLNNLPKSGGGAPIPGQFRYHATPTGLSYTFTIPLQDGVFIDVAQACSPVPAKVYIVAHAEVDTNGSQAGGGETAWGGDTPGPGRRWWFYGAYTMCCTTTEPPPELTGCETAFAKGGYVFVTDQRANPESLLSLNLIKQRWGWAINLTVPGVTTYDIWAGAGLNRLANGTKVGTLTVDWDGSSVTVTYQMSAGYMMTESHLYAGDTKPTTTAPGQYGNLKYSSDPAGDTTHVYTVPLADTNLIDGVWLIAHAVVCNAPAP